MRNIALSTTVTLLVPVERHANANGLVGTVQGIAFIVTSVFSGLAIGLAGMGWTLAIAVAFTLVALVHLVFVRIPEDKPAAADGRAPAIDLRGSITAIRAATGLFALIVFSTFNNLIGGLYMALMDPYGLTLFPVEIWGVVLGISADRLHRRRARHRQVRARAQPDPHHAAPRRRDGGARLPSSPSASGGGCTPSASGSTCA